MTEERVRKPKVNDLGQHEILCADCEQVLLIMMQTEESDKVTKSRLQIVQNAEAKAG